VTGQNRILEDGMRK